MKPEKRGDLDQRPLTEFFKEAVDTAIMNLNVDPSAEASFYIVNLLKEFSRSEKVFEKTEAKLHETPLALLLERAVHGSAETRLKTLKYIGDVSLYFAGFFPLHIAQKSVDIDYYMAMGGGAYQTLAHSLFKPHTFAEIFEELGTDFGQFVKIVNEVNLISGQKTDLDLIKLYERWLSTGDERIESILNRAGIATTAPTRNVQ